ncbi:MAG TPA: 6-phospho-beta-glucosidase [Streptosporangiaceae bacterium]|nr:6-phospho-beta-glucosidase [Streptosporangiaceae bacterium]
MKLAVVGGGSTYTPELVDGLARLADQVKIPVASGGRPPQTSPMKISELVLVDPDQSRLDVVGPVSERIMRRYGHPARLSWTADLDGGLDGAGAVVIQLRIGGQAARQRDETWPLEYGCIGQETTGAGGLAKALRTVPVVLDIAERARQRAAGDAWIIDFTNPVGIVTRALLDAGHRAIGLCNVAIGFQRQFAELLDIPPERVELDHVGLNHLTWERAAYVDGADVLPGLIAAHQDEVAGRTGMDKSVINDLGVVPSYYLHYFYEHDAAVAALRGQPTRAEQVAAIERELLEMYADPALDRKPELLTHRGGAFYSEAAVALLASLVTDARDRQVLNVRNAGTFDFLGDDAVIEVPAVVGADGPVPLPATPLEPGMRGLVAHVTAYEELAVAAATRGGSDRVRAALLAHPLIGQHELAGRLTDRLIAENERFLPWAQGH